MRIIAFVTDAAPIDRILDHIGEPVRSCTRNAEKESPSPPG
ncbi:hypothetical protein [Thiocapsa marina]|uniref:Uncharacterized protein n=1 Tax=Thiocapsa marina 5811 TaxID=768671 RepID=F9UA24_9GAMM|nr:hypothetical protein [Thiocapsa marina]EGV18972.1 hypothetical protein ThimaDRAFT_1776 [Thiocapsa marina 5811]